MNAATFFSRWRVRLGYPLAILVLWFARPNPRSILLAIPVGLVGLLLRARAAGYLHKQEVLTVTGPYAYTRNPLYLGSAVLSVAAALGTHSWISAATVCGYFALFYSVVMRREEDELGRKHGVAFDEYARAVPLFFPRLTAAKFPFADAGVFSWAQYRKNREYRAATGFGLLLLILVVLWRARLPVH